ncbi:biliverdin-producing heme oxygenase [Acetobacter estunensis]|nr:biliverdin-producing heme oxygenase [Acetobacter estunensis]MBV1836606.1 biliverdin-producing heme oxygenase [Acetobacter estunensis]
MNEITLRGRLRSATRPLHNELDALIEPLTTPEAYRRYVRGIAGFRLSGEEALRSACWPEALNDWRPTFLKPELLADLADLELEAAPVGDVLVLDCPEKTVGLAYVLEGSALGARVLIQQAQALGFDQNFGARHLVRQVSRPTHWSGFVERLEKMDYLAPDKVMSAACTAFVLARDAMIQG